MEDDLREGGREGEGGGGREGGRVCQWVKEVGGRSIWEVRGVEIRRGREEEKEGMRRGEKEGRGKGGKEGGREGGRVLLPGGGQ